MKQNRFITGSEPDHSIQGRQPFLFFFWSLLSLWFLPLLLSAQIVDGFDDGNDNGWTRFDPLGELKVASPATFSFPNGAYRLVAPVPAVPDAGAARAVSYRDDLVLGDFYTAVDLVDWDNRLDLGVGLGIRLNHVGLGQTDGYVVMFYANPSGSNPYGEFEITRIVGEAGGGTLAVENVKLDPDRSYRMVATSTGAAIKACLYDLEDLTRPLSQIMIEDGSEFPEGRFGLVTFYRGGDVTGSNSSADATFDNFVLQATPPAEVSLPATTRGIPGAPQVVDRSPVSRAQFHLANDGITFKASTLTPVGIDASGIQLFLNGMDVSGDLQMSGNPNEVRVAYHGLTPGRIYHAEIRLTSAEGLTTTHAFRFDTLVQEELMSVPYVVIEAEDFNFGAEQCDFLDPFLPLAGGRFLDRPTPTNVDLDDNILPAGVLGYAKRVGLPDVDYFDFSGLEQLGADDSYYRYCDTPGVRFAHETPRVPYMRDGLQEQEVYRTEAGEWLNYTRTFHGDKLNAYLRVAGRWAQDVRLDRVTGDPSSIHQQTEELGVFHVPNTVADRNHIYVPLTDRQGNPVELDLDGENTIRMTIEGESQAFSQKWTLFINYLLFVPSLMPPPLPESFSLTITTSNDNLFAFSFPTQPGVTYIPEYMTSLEGGPWTTLPAVEGDGAPATVDGGRHDSRRFYRVRTQ